MQNAQSVFKTVLTSGLIHPPLNNKEPFIGIEPNSLVFQTSAFTWLALFPNVSMNRIELLSIGYQPIVLTFILHTYMRLL